MDNSDGIEGLYLEKVAVAGRDMEGDRTGTRRSAAAQLVGGIPFRHYVSAQCGKEHCTVQVCEVQCVKYSVMYGGLLKLLCASAAHTLCMRLQGMV